MTILPIASQTRFTYTIVFEMLFRTDEFHFHCLTTTDELSDPLAVQDGPSTGTASDTACTHVRKEAADKNTSIRSRNLGRTKYIAKAHLSSQLLK
jgi:hypothetical protein